MITLDQQFSCLFNSYVKFLYLKFVFWILYYYVKSINMDFVPLQFNQKILILIVRCNNWLEYSNSLISLHTLEGTVKFYSIIVRQLIYYYSRLALEI